MTEKKHYGLARLARHKALSGWGVKANTQSEALQLTAKPEASAEGALLELVRRLNQAIQAWEDDSDDKEDGEGERPPHACPFPNVQIGDMLYCPDELACKPLRYVVVHKDNEGYVRIVALDHDWADSVCRIHLEWGTIYHTTSSQDAARQGALECLAWYEPNYRQARAVLDALDKGLPYEHLLGDPDQKEDN